MGDKVPQPIEPTESASVAKSSTDSVAAIRLVEYWARTLPVRSELHLIRKVWHATMGLIVVALYLGGMPHNLALTILGGLFIFSITMELRRLRNPALNERCIRFFGPIIRSNEVNRISGMPYYIASAMIAVAIFPRDVAVLSMLFLALGDPISSLVGILCKGRSVKILPGKSLHGTAAGFLVCAAASWFYLQSEGWAGLDLIRMVLLGGFAGAVSELLPLELDDNFTIPVVSGFILWLGFIAMQFI